MTDPTTSGAAPRVVVRNLTKVYRTRRGEHVALDNVSLDVADGEALVLLGPSGCGKTTLLRCVAGLERPDSGEILVHGEVVFSSEKQIFKPPERRRLSMVFQSYALWPHMTVAQNVGYPLTNAGVKKAEMERRVAAVLEMVGLGTYGTAYSGQMSGGQQQRVALARAIVSNEGIVLFDEPLSNLDAKVRERLRLELLTLQRDIGFSSLYVTHDQAEAMALADRIAVMNAGRIEQVGRGDDIYGRPASHYVATFIGKANEIPGKVLGVEGGYCVVETAIGTVRGVADAAAQSSGATVAVLIRPEHIRLGSGASEENRFSGKLAHSMFLGTHVECVIEVGGVPFIVTLDEGAVPANADALPLSMAPERVRIFAPAKP